MREPPFNEEALRRAFAGRRVLITGHTGFKGGWLALWLHRLGAHIVGAALPPDRPSLFEALRLEQLLDHRIADLRDAEGFAAAMADVDAEIMFHLAAQPLVRRSYEIPADTFLVNVVGTARALDAARRMPSLKAVIVVTSDKCYENIEDRVWGYRETDRMGGSDPYSASKGCTELLVESYRRSFFRGAHMPALASVRAGNVIGGGDWSQDRLLPDLMRAAATGEAAHIRNPSSTRPWQHVLDSLAGYLELGAKLLDEGQRWAEGWNFGPDRDAIIDVRSVATQVQKCWAGDLDIEFGTGDAVLHEAHSLSLDNSKARLLLGWRPRLSVAEAISLSIAWYRANASHADMRGFSLDQIDQYASRAHPSHSTTMSEAA